MKREKGGDSIIDFDAILEPSTDEYVDDSVYSFLESVESSRLGVEWDEGDDTSIVDSRSTDAFDCMSVLSRPTSSNNAKCLKSKKSKSTGKFKCLIKLKKVEQNGRMRTIAQGMDMKRVPMNNDRMRKVRSMMTLHNNFKDLKTTNSTQAMVDHFTCLMILSEAYTRNGQGKADKYPRYLRIFVGPGGCFSKHTEIKRDNHSTARKFALKYVTEVKVHTHNVKMGGNKVPVVQAPEKKRNSLIKKLVGNYMHGFDDYVSLLEDLEAGIISLPEQSDLYSTPLSSLGSLISVSKSVRRKRQFLGDPNSPCAALVYGERDE